MLAEGMPDKFEWLNNQADAMTECGDPTGALQLLKDAFERFGEDGMIRSSFRLRIGLD